MHVCSLVLRAEVSRESETPQTIVAGSVEGFQILSRIHHSELCLKTGTAFQNGSGTEVGVATNQIHGCSRMRTVVRADRVNIRQLQEK